MSKESSGFLVPAGKQIKLKDYDTSYSGDLVKETGKAMMAEVKKRLASYQEVLYAGNTRSILIIFQAMDAGGKDSAIRHVMSGLNPQGCQIFFFKTPSSNEYDHDFLWRHYLALPQRGRIGIHNRSHYENVLIAKVHPEYVLNERIPGYETVKDIDKEFWKTRLESIRNFEKHLTANGTLVLKFFLHVSEDAQKKRFLNRINDPTKNWKFSSSDISERSRWKQYMAAYEEAISATSTADAPWYVIPADKKWFARLSISQVLEETFKSLNLQYPELPEEENVLLEKYKKKLLAEV